MESPLTIDEAKLYLLDILVYRRSARIVMAPLKVNRCKKSIVENLRKSSVK